MSKNTKYDIVVVVNKGVEDEVHIYEKRTSEFVRAIMQSMDEDKVFLVLDDDMRQTFFKPNEISKLQFNLRESWTR